MIKRDGNRTTSGSELRGLPNGSLKWCGNEVVGLYKMIDIRDNLGPLNYAHWIIFTNKYCIFSGFFNSIPNNSSATYTFPASWACWCDIVSPVWGGAYSNHVASNSTSTTLLVYNYRSYSSSTNSITCYFTRVGVLNNLP